MVQNFKIVSLIADLPLTGREKLEFGRIGAGEEHLPRSTNAAILIGRNGSGKSMLLREIVQILRAYSEKESPRRPRVNLTSELVVEVDGIRRSLPTFRDSSSSREFRSQANPLEAGPRRIIALSFTPFDKFPASDRPRDLIEEDGEDPYYVYLGFRSELGISPRGRLLRSIDGLVFAGSSPQSDERAAATLAAIGYGPEIKVTYDLTASLLSRGSARQDHRLAPYRQELIERYNLQNFRDAYGRSGISYRINLRDGRYDQESPIPYEALRELVRARLLRVVSVKLRRSHSESVELLDLSSGELNILSGFLGLAAHLQDGSLILIDEPENSLHPEWQVQYVAMLEAVLSQHRGCQYVIATHAPLIVSGMASSDELSTGVAILRLDQSPPSISEEVVADESPDSTLVTAFDVVTIGNSYIRQVVLEALSLIQTGQAESERAKEISTFLASRFESIPVEDGIKKLAASVVESITSAGAHG